MTLRTRDQAELVDAQVSFHLNAGVDFVIATDHRSQDGTVEILESWARTGYLHLIRETGDRVRGSEWRTRMAQLAASEYGADWVFGADGDEFWWPRTGTLKDVLAAVPDRFGVVWCVSRQFAPRPDDGRFFAERMIVRVSSVAPINDPTSFFRPHAKLAHRADPGIVIDRGSHSVAGTSLRPLYAWHPIEVFHFPVRSQDQYESKSIQWRLGAGQKALAQYVKASDAHQEGRIADTYGTLLVDDDTLARGLAEGSLAVDTRLRDALRALSVEGGRFLPPSPEGPRVSSPAPHFPEKAALELEALAWREANVVRLHRRLDELRGRLGRLEARTSAHPARRAPDAPERHRWRRDREEAPRA
jgi:Glycosyl transferase family 2